jgi:hypothetical protein
MELGDFEQAKEHFIRVLEIEAPEDLRGLESHVLRALPERVTFLRWSLPGPPREYASSVLWAPGIFASAFLPLAGARSL